MLENLNFRWEEWGFEKPEDIPEPPEEPIKEEVKEEEPDFKKMNAKEKKEWEAKQKEKDEEKWWKEEEKRKAFEEREAQRAALRAAIPQITRQEIDKFRAILTSYADIYVNDALDQSLTSSNTISELWVNTWVMGVWMTEEIRKLGKFFLYPCNPLVMAIGGADEHSIWDRILLFNSMLDMGPRDIIVGGWIALYFLKALGMKVGIDDSNVIHDLLPICINMMKKANERGIQVLLPKDFVIVEKPKVEASDSLH